MPSVWQNFEERMTDRARTLILGIGMLLIINGVTDRSVIEGIFIGLGCGLVAFAVVER